MTDEQLLAMAVHFVVDERTEIGRTNNGNRFRVVRYGTPSRGGYAELMTLMLGRDGHWHDRPDGLDQEWDQLTGFDTAKEAFEVLASEKEEPGFLGTWRKIFDCDPLPLNKESQ